MPYEAPNVPANIEQLSAFLQEELVRLAGELRGTQTLQVLQFVVLHNAPEKPRQGMVVYADGTNWNPGSGEGLYRYDGTTWNYLG